MAIKDISSSNKEAKLEKKRCFPVYGSAESSERIRRKSEARPPLETDGPPIPTGYRARTVAEVRGPERATETRGQRLLVYNFIVRLVFLGSSGSDAMATGTLLMVAHG